MADEKLGWGDPAPFAKEETLAGALLVPTRIYVKPLLTALEATGGSEGAIKALAHITGGGLTENVPRVLPASVAARIDLASWQAPAVFGWLARAGRLEGAEMLRTFNCGIGMVVVVGKGDADGLVRLLQEWGEAPHVIGEIIAPTGEKSSAKGKGDAWAVAYSGALRYEA